VTRRRRAHAHRAWLALVCGWALLGCGRVERLEACNIATKDCQESIYYAVIRLRGDGWDPFDGIPPIHTITLADYRKQLLAEDAAAAPPDPNAKPKFDPWSVALQLVGLVTPTMSAGAASVASRVNNVAAFYSSATRKVTVIDRGDQHDDRSDTTLLAHELVHAFQDNELSGDIHGSSTDGSFTAHALIEGEAVLYEHLVGAELDNVEPQQLDWTKYYRDWTSGLRKQVPSNKSPFYAVSWFVYPFGASLLTNGWLRGGNAAVRRLAEHFPTRSVELMASIDGTHASSAAALSCNVQPPSEMFTRTGYDRFGGMQLYAFLTAAGVDEAEAWRLGKRARDDLWWIYSLEATQKVALSWRIRMTDEASADAVVEAAAMRDHIHAERKGADVLIVGSNDEALLDWPGANDCQ
jgi:hypothetical protein